MIIIKYYVIAIPDEIGEKQSVAISAIASSSFFKEFLAMTKQNITTDNK